MDVAKLGMAEFFLSGGHPIIILASPELHHQTYLVIELASRSALLY